MTTPDDRQLEDSVGSILASYGRRGELAHLEGGSLPSREVIWGVVEDLLRVLFPGYLETSDLVAADLAARTMTRVRSIAGRLRTEIERGLRFQSGRAVSAADCEDCGPRAEAATLKLLAEIPDIRAVLGTDIEAAYDGDPAAQSLQEIILAYPGLQATAVY